MVENGSDSSDGVGGNALLLLSSGLLLRRLLRLGCSARAAATSHATGADVLQLLLTAQLQAKTINGAARARSSGKATRRAYQHELDNNEPCCRHPDHDAKSERVAV
jgi:hypothetical protein